MTAKEARDKALDIALAANKKQYDEIMEIIKRAVDRAELTCNYYEYIKLVVKDQLEKDGFKVSSSYDQREGTIVTIGW
jgi:hypothetical protein